MAAKGIRAGRAFVELGVNTTALERGLKNAGAKLNAFGGGIRNMGAKIAGLGVAMAAPFAAATKVFMSMGDELDKMSARVGASVPFLSKLSHAAKIGGTDLKAMETGIRRLQRTAMDATRGLSPATEAFDQLGISVTDQNGNLKTTEQLFMEAARALSGIENNTKKAALATMIFGRAGTSLLPMLENGEAGLLAVMQQAEDLGLVMSEEDAAAAAALTDAFGNLWSSVKMGVFRIGSALAPTLQKVAEVFVELSSKVGEFLNKNRELIRSAFMITLGVIAFGSTLVGLGVGIQVVGFALTGLATGLGLITALLGAILSPLGLVTAAVVGAGAAFLKWTETGQQMQEKALGIFQGIKDHALLMFGGIQDALAAGEWKLAATIAWQGIKQPFVSGWNFIREGFQAVRLLVSQVWADLFNGIAEKVTKFVGWFTKKFGRVIKFFNADFDLDEWNKKTDEWVRNKNEDRSRSADRASADRARKFNQASLKIQDDERENRKELARLREQAREKRATREADLAAKETPEPTPPPETPDLPTGAKGFGAFSAAAVGRMARQVEQKIQAQQLETLRTIADNTATQPNAVVWSD